ncbi:MAG TPA: NAD-dependent epimerase/dehydratase family protein [Candidatus Limnocylindrales bacterium]|jgi:nucleoside-diphosphate-sugar epimerase
MQVFVTGGAGFIGSHVVALLRARGDDVVATVRDRGRASALVGLGCRIVESDLADASVLAELIRGADAAIHIAGSYRIGIRPSERAAMWDANVGTTQRVLDAAIAAGVGRIVYVSTNNVFGDTGGRIVDETYRRDPDAGFVSWYDETKFRAHEAAEARIRRGAPVVIAQPGGVYGPGDHSEAGAQLLAASRGELRYLAVADAGLAWVHVDDVAAGIVAVLDRGRIGEAYSLAGDCLRLGEAIGLAAHARGRRPPRLRVPTALLRAIAPLADRVGGLPGLPPNLTEVIRASDGVTYWASHDKATRELGWRPRPFEQGLRDTFATALAAAE